MDSKHAEAKSLLERALANVESAAGRHLRGDLGRAAAFIEDALKALDGASVPAQPGAAAPLTWTREKPKVDGWYWYRVPGQAKQSIDLVQLFTGSPCWHSAERHAWVPITWDLEWSGPIPEPGAPASSPSQDSQEVEPVQDAFYAGFSKGWDAVYEALRPAHDDLKWCRKVIGVDERWKEYRALLSQSPKGAAGAEDDANMWELEYGEPSAPKTGLRGAGAPGDGDVRTLVKAAAAAMEDIEIGDLMQWPKGLALVDALRPFAQPAAPGDVGSAGGDKA